MLSPLRAALDEARCAPFPSGFRSTEAAWCGTEGLRDASPAIHGHHLPRDPDEFHTAASGGDTFRRDGKRGSFLSGNAPFAAGAVRVEGFGVARGGWAISYGSKGGEDG